MMRVTLQAIAEEIGQLKDHLKSIANSKVGDKYIFNGTNTLNPPITDDMADADIEFGANKC